MSSPAPKVKMAQKVAASILKYSLVTDPAPVDPSEIGADPWNRNGARPNIQVISLPSQSHQSPLPAHYPPKPFPTHHHTQTSTTPIQVIHSTLATSILQDGYDARRPLPGVCILKSERKLPDLLDWNDSFSKGDNRYPTVNRSSMNKGSLAATHLVFTLRCFQEEMMSPITGLRFAVDPVDTALANAVSRGHVWYILSDELPEQEAIMISEYRNSDNNTNQFKHEMEHIRGIQRVCLKEMDTAKSVVLSTVLAKAMAHLQVPVVSSTMLSLAKFVVDLGAGVMVDEVCEFHSSEINPGDLTLPHVVFDEVTKSVGKQAGPPQQCNEMHAFLCQKVNDVKKCNP